MTYRASLSLLPLTALLATGCAFEQTVSTPLSPSADAFAPPSLVGSWSSSATTSIGSSCTNLQWRITAQSGASLSAEFSADCVGGISVSGTASGEVAGNDVRYQISGTAVAPGGISCPVTIAGTARIEGDALRLPYAGDTCFGPVRGEEVLRRRSSTGPSTPTEPKPEDPKPEDPKPEEPRTPTTNPHHVGPGPVSFDRAEQVIRATGREFPHLTTARGSESESVAGTTELLRRMIWHLQLAGFQAGRQKNGSGAISGDKLTIHVDGAWHAFDVFRSVGTAGSATEVIFLEVYPASTIADGGIGD